MANTSIVALRKKIRARRAKTRNHQPEKWREIGVSFPGVPLGTLCRIAHDRDYTPKSPVLRAHLGLAPLPVEVSPCGKCGQLHAFRVRCPDAPPKYAPHPVMRLSKVRRILQSMYKEY